ncbi:hypothetical protein M9458_020945, partial [Cirrhinus mrigala]
RTSSISPVCCSPVSTRSPFTRSAPNNAPKTRASASSRRPVRPSGARAPNPSPVPETQ